MDELMLEFYLRKYTETGDALYHQAYTRLQDKVTQETLKKEIHEKGN